MALGTLEKFFILLFTAIIVGVIVTNGPGVNSFFRGLADLSGRIVNEFSGGKGFAGRSGIAMV